MAIVNNGVRVSIPSQLVPVGFVPPAVTTFSDEEYIRKITLNVLKSTVENAAKETTLLNIIQDALIGVSKQVEDIMSADYIATNTVTFWTDLKVLSSNISVSRDSNFLDNSPVNYVVNVEVYIKTV